MVEEHRARSRTDQTYDGGPERFGQTQVGVELVAIGGREGRCTAAFDPGRDPRRAQPGRDPATRADHALGCGRCADADQDPLAERPGRVDRVLAPIREHVGVDAFGGAAQRELAQRQQIAALEESLRRTLRLGAEIDLPLAQAHEEILGLEIDDDDFIGAIHHGVGNRFAHAHAGDLRDHVVQALDVLHVQRRVHVDAGVEQLEDVLPALGMAPAGRVRVRQLVDQDHLRLARERRVEVELLEIDAAMGDAPARQDVETEEQRSGVVAAVRLDPADDDDRACSWISRAFWSIA